MMAERPSVAYAILGVFSVVVLALLGAFILHFVGRSVPMGPAFKLEATFASVLGLKPGVPVSLHGAVIGSVSDIYIDDAEEDVRLVAVLSISDDPRHLRWLRTDSTFRVITDNVFGDKRVEITGGRTGRPLARGERVSGEVGASLQEALDEIRGLGSRLGPGVESLGGALSGLGAAANRPDVLMKMLLLIENLAWLSGQMRGALREQDLAGTWRNLSQTAANLNQLTTRLVEMSDRLERLLPPAPPEAPPPED